MRLKDLYISALGAAYLFYAISSAASWLLSWLDARWPLIIPGAAPDIGLSIGFATIGGLLLQQWMGGDEGFKAAAVLVGSFLAVALMTLQLLVAGASALNAYILSAIGEEWGPSASMELCRADVVLGAFTAPVIRLALRRVREVVGVAARA